MMYTCISLIVHPPFEIPGSAPDVGMFMSLLMRYNYINIIRYFTYIIIMAYTHSYVHSYQINIDN